MEARLKIPSKQILIAVGTTLALAAPQASAAATLQLCEIADGSDKDLDKGTPGKISGSCSTALGTFAGTLQETKRRHYDSMKLTGTLTGQGSLTFSNTYDIGPWIGIGWEEAYLQGELVTSSPKAPFSVSLTGFATTFSNNSAVAIPLADPPDIFGWNVRNGGFSGPGALIGTLTWNITSGGVIQLAPAEVMVTLISPAVPEPSTWAMILIGFAFVGAQLRRRQNLALD